MKKVIHIFMLFLLSLCLCGQTTQITTVYAATGKKTASTTISKKKKNKKKKTEKIKQEDKREVMEES